MKRILFITNGHGEDIVAAHIINDLKRSGLKIDVLPVVGTGSMFNRLKVNVIGPKKALPSGGFGFRNYSYLIKDLFSGLIGKIAAQIKAVRANKGQYDLVIGIGDIVPILYAMLTKCRFIFVGVNKSEYYKKLAFNYTGPERWLLKKYCSLTLGRDKKTAETLKLQGIKTRYVGNPMMDGVQNIRPSGYQEIRKTKTIGFLPGTRRDAYKNVDDFVEIARYINKLNNNIRFILSFPKTLDRKKLALENNPFKFIVIRDFNKALNKSDIVIGLSGTGNEQTAGLGIPVIAFPGRGAQFNPRFAAGQKELLGDALLLLPRDHSLIAEKAVALMRNNNAMRQMSRSGKERMGKPGASKKIAEIINKNIKRSKSWT